jgi:hypothetical protein
VLAALGIVLNDSLTRLNALKQGISFSCNIAAAIYFVFSGEVVWPIWPLSKRPVVLALVAMPSVAVTVCGAPSLLVQVTVVPGLTVRVWGAKAKSWIVTLVPPAAEAAGVLAPVAELPHPASTITASTAAMAGTTCRVLRVPIGVSLEEEG